MSAKNKMRAAVFANEFGDLVLAVDNHELAAIIWDDADEAPVLVVWDRAGNPVSEVDLADLLSEKTLAREPKQVSV